VPETATEEAQLGAQEKGGANFVIYSTDSDDVDFILSYEPRRHDHEASSSTVEKILERMEHSDRANVASFAEIRACQDEFQQQQLQMQQR
jgi:hypothetical protein